MIVYTLHWVLALLLLVGDCYWVHFVPNMFAREGVTEQILFNNSLQLNTTLILALSSSVKQKDSNAECKISDVTPLSKPPTKTLQLDGEATSIFHKAMSLSFDK